MHPFTLLGDPVRLCIVGLLARRELPVWRIVESVGPQFRVGQSAISHHLKVLRDEGFVIARADGLSRRYRLAWDALARLDAAVEELFVAWDERDGWPYEDRMIRELRDAGLGGDQHVRRHRAGRAGLRGRTEAEIEQRADGEPWWFPD